LGSERVLRRQKRNNKEVPTIAIVGYTNAGKSTLLNALTGANVYTKNELFATLDPTSRRLRFPTEREVVLIDTVGFIRDLPQSLIKAFRTTLEELHDADLLLHIVDVSDPHKEQHVKVVESILSDLKIDKPERLLVLNKLDLVSSEEVEVMEKHLTAIAISAKTRMGFEKLLNRVAENLWHAEAIKKYEDWGVPPKR
jgi:GTPase